MVSRKMLQRNTFARAMGGVAAAVVLAPSAAADPAPLGPPVVEASDSPLLSEVAAQIGLPADAWTAAGTHTAKGYTTKAATTTSVEGMEADCDNINLNKKLAADFRSDVFGDGMKGFFYRCDKVAPDTNKYWFVVSSIDPAKLDTLCDPATTYPIVYDRQHHTYWMDEPFTCTDRFGPTA